MRRVVVTGAGCISAIGNDVATFAENLFAGRTGIADLTDFPAGDLRFSKVAAVRDFVASEWVSAAQRQVAERTAQFALAAARQAISASGLLASISGEDVAVILGCSTGGRTAEEPETAKLYTQGGRVHPLTVPRTMASSGTSLVCMEHGLTGPAYTVTTACASATHAIGQAFHMVRSGTVRAAVTGGHEAPLTYGFLKSWDSLHVVSSTVCRPFAKDRDGMTLGEGAAVFTLEAMDEAVDRGATILAEIVGFGMSSDASHITQPHAAGPAAAMTRALRDAGAAAQDVGYVNAHGTGTEANDRVEAQALLEVFGEAGRELPVSSTKSLHGHAMGASGALEFLATCLAVQRGTAPAAVPCAELDEALGLRGILRENQALDKPVALSNSFAFGGLNGVIAVRRFEAGS
ncbi:beta-ketoacyl-[acyl-carrier-protein] synthase family protein [Terriglobus aquaticus]|uniref:Nodulation protein E n=1 Tax=Terriglobus aquaticus TaxID=940139 RepID=A0ABW9KKI4_9BACT|nr:beta-ketoacyl-[acyl-carrier-protein] synthase family protein [Terriglobus aquaticus]